MSARYLKAMISPHTCQILAHSACLGSIHVIVTKNVTKAWGIRNSNYDVMMSSKTIYSYVGIVTIMNWLVGERQGMHVIQGDLSNSGASVSKLRIG
jgi:hypothetical protein